MYALFLERRQIKYRILKFYQDSVLLPEVVMNEIKPIFVDLSKDLLPKRCIGGKTQYVKTAGLVPDQVC